MKWNETGEVESRSMNGWHRHPALFRILTDFLRVVREPIMLIFLFVPILVSVVFRLLWQQGFPLIETWAGVDPYPYAGYLTVFAFLVTPQLMGTVSGFLMIDERDEHIWPLVAVTPLGERGYLVNRLFLPFFSSILYALIAYAMVRSLTIPVLLLAFVCVLSGMEGILFSLVLFRFSQDKVKGLTLSKGMGIFLIFPLADLFEVEWFSLLAGFVPFTWMGRLLMEPVTPVRLFLAAGVHLIWIAFLWRSVMRQNVK